MEGPQSFPPNADALRGVIAVTGEAEQQNANLQRRLVWSCPCEEGPLRRARWWGDVRPREGAADAVAPTHLSVFTFHALSLTPPPRASSRLGVKLRGGWSGGVGGGPMGSSMPAC